MYWTHNEPVKVFWKKQIGSAEDAEKSRIEVEKSRRKKQKALAKKKKRKKRYWEASKTRAKIFEWYFLYVVRVFFLEDTSSFDFLWEKVIGNAYIEYT